MSCKDPCSALLNGWWPRNIFFAGEGLGDPHSLGEADERIFGKNGEVAEDGTHRNPRFFRVRQPNPQTSAFFLGVEPQISGSTSRREVGPGLPQARQAWRTCGGCPGLAPGAQGQSQSQSQSLDHLGQSTAQGSEFPMLPTFWRLFGPRGNAF